MIWLIIPFFFEKYSFVFARYLSINRGQDKRPIKHRTAAYQRSTACELVVEMINTLMPDGLLMDLLNLLPRATDNDGLKAITSSVSVGAYVFGLTFC